MDKKDFMLNYLASYAPLNRLNMPELAVQNFLETPDSLIQYDDFYVYSWRIRYLADAYRRSGEIDKSLDVFNYESDKFPSARVDQVKASILGSLPNRQVELVEFLKVAEQKDYVDRHFSTVLEEAIQSWRLRANDSTLNSGEFLHDFLNRIEVKDNENQVAASYYYLGKYHQAEKILSPVLKPDSKSQNLLSLMARIQLHLKNEQKAKRWFDRLTELEIPYDRGLKEYAMAQVLAVKGDKEGALNLLEQAVDNGVLFMFYRFDGDPDLKELWNEPRYQKIISKRRIPFPD